MLPIAVGSTFFCPKCIQNIERTDKGQNLNIFVLGTYKLKTLGT